MSFAYIKISISGGGPFTFGSQHLLHLAQTVAL